MKERIERAMSAGSFAGGLGLMVFGAMKYMETPMYQHSTLSSPLYYTMGLLAYLGAGFFPTIAGFIGSRNERNSVSLYDTPAQSVGRKLLYAGLGAASALSWIVPLAMIRG